VSILSVERVRNHDPARIKSGERISWGAQVPKTHRRKESSIETACARKEGRSSWERKVSGGGGGQDAKAGGEITDGKGGETTKRKTRGEGEGWGVLFQGRKTLKQKLGKGGISVRRDLRDTRPSVVGPEVDLPGKTRAAKSKIGVRNGKQNWVFNKPNKGFESHASL